MQRCGGGRSFRGQECPRSLGRDRVAGLTPGWDDWRQVSTGKPLQACPWHQEGGGLEVCGVCGAACGVVLAVVGGRCSWHTNALGPIAWHGLTAGLSVVRRVGGLG